MPEYKEQFCPSCGHYKYADGFERSKHSKMHICPDCKQNEDEKEESNETNK